MPTLKHRSLWFDAKRPRVISVTKEDARSAICKDHQNCVIAKAIKRQCNAEWVDVGANTVLIKPYGTAKYIRYRLGSKAKEQVRFFDEEGKFAPCFVELATAPPSQQIGAWAKRNDEKRKLYLKTTLKNRSRLGMKHRIAKPSR